MQSSKNPSKPPFEEAENPLPTVHLKINGSDLTSSTFTDYTYEMKDEADETAVDLTGTISDMTKTFVNETLLTNVGTFNDYTSDLSDKTLLREKPEESIEATKTINANVSPTPSSIFNAYKTTDKLPMKDLTEAMKAAVTEVGPRVYNIDLKGQSKIHVLVLGCQGQGKGTRKKSAQEEIAELINALSEDEKNAPIFVLGLGDNAYDYGASHPYDSSFKNCFHDIYGDSKLPFFLVLGNHDKAFCEKAYYYNRYVKKIPLGDEVAINQLAHTYGMQGKEKEKLDALNISNAEKETLQRARIEHRITELSKENVDPADLSGQFNIPNYCYSLITGDTQYFCLDSNSFGIDFLNFFSGKKHPNKVNQFEWLAIEYTKAKSSGKKIIFAQHQFLFTNGKRAEKYDTHHYLEPTEVKALNDLIKKITLLSILKTHLNDTDWKNFNESAKNLSCEETLNLCKNFFSEEQLEIFKQAFPEDTNEYAELVARMFECLNLHPDLILSAHDHYMGYFNNKLDKAAKRTICQFTSGGGGGHKQEPKSLHGRPYATTLSEHGVGILSYDAKNPQEFQMEIYTPDPEAKAKNKIVPKLQAIFTDKSHIPKYDVQHHNPQLENLRERVLKICDAFIVERQKLEIEAKKKNPIKQLSYENNLPSNSKYSLFGFSPSNLTAWFTKQETTSVPEQVTGFFKSYVKPVLNIVGMSNNHLSDEINCVNKLQLYFQQPVTPPLDDLVNYLLRTLDSLSEKEKPESLHYKFNQSLLDTEFFKDNFINHLLIPTALVC